MRIKKLGLIALTASLLLTTGCFRKNKEIVDLKPNEVAFVINNVSNKKDDTSTKFDGSRESWSKIRSSSKMITVDIVGIDVGTIKNRRIPSKKVIVVSEGIATREWVESKERGTSKTDQSIKLESQSGTEFHIGINMSAKVSDAEKYVSVFGIDPNSSIDDVRVSSTKLEYVLDTTIRSNIQGYLNEEFGHYPTFEIQSKKSEVVNKVKLRVEKDLAENGITLLSFNAGDNVTWTDPTIQGAINARAKAEADLAKNAVEQEVKTKEAETKRLVEEQEQLKNARAKEIDAEMQKTIAEIDRLKAQENNKKELEKAENEVLISKEKSKTIDSEKKLLELEEKRTAMKVRLMEAEAKLEEARKWNGVKELSNLKVTGMSSIVGENGEVKTLNVIK